MSVSDSKYFAKILICTIVITGIVGLSYLEIKYAQQINNFTMTVYKGIALKEDNVVSPYSIHLASTLLALGARGQTAKDMLTILYPDGLEYLKRATQTVLKASNSLRGVTINIANKIYIKRGIALSDNYKRNVKKYLLTDVSNLDFSNSVKAASTINDWISTSTKGKITSLINPSDLSSDTMIALLNAIYFKGNWNKPFDPKNTVRGSFFNEPTVSVEVDLMQQRNEFPYAYITDLDAQVLEMFYEGKTVSMVCILPTELDGIKQLEAKLTSNYDIKKNIFDKLELQNVTVTIPKFKIEKQIDLGTVFPEIGLESVFSPDADFTGITANKIPLQVTKAIHKAIIEVDEKGTVAAAVTAILGTYSMEMAFYVNRPFIVVIKNNESGMIYFIAKKQQF